MRMFSLPVGMLLAIVGCSTSDSGVQPKSDGGDPDGGPRSATCMGSARYANAWVSDPNLCVYVFATGLGSPRQMAFAPNGDVFVNNGSVTVLWDANQDGQSDETERATFAKAPALNHGLAFSRDGKFLYASSPGAVYRWPYTPGARTAPGNAEVVVKNIPSDGHAARTLAFDSQGRLYVNVGSSGNVDTAQSLRDTRAQIRRFAIPATIPQGGINYATGEVVARGMRNEVGLFVDAQDRLWGVENGRDDLVDPGLGGDIHQDNPGEEINLVDGQGATFYGYPDCFSELKIANGKGPGTQWADKGIDSPKTDAWCQDRANVRPPVFVMPAHWAPLGIVQYTGNALPFAGDFVIAAHGSWNRVPATGRLLARARYSNGTIVSVDPLVGEKDASGGLAQGADSAPRPVDVRQGPDGALYYTDDDGGRIFKVGYATASSPDAGAGPDDGLPQHLRDTGLYADFAAKTIASGIVAYTPGLQLWSDGAEKQRYISLPPGKTIDTSDMDEWRFPVGTKVWKEFRIGGARIETRIYFKCGATDWSWATYRWTSDESDAARLDSGATNVAGGSYEIPNHAACNKCHGGRTDKLLGVEAIALALPGAQGLTLAELAKSNALSSPPAKTQATLPEDATGKAGAALGWLHMNCGVSCHNRNSGADATLGGFYARLPAAEVLAGGADVNALDTWKTGANVKPGATKYQAQIDAGYKRILPGDASKSLVRYVIDMRNDGQMPPIVSHQVDAAGVKAVADWIGAR